ncbi:MAG TPA: molybdopterin cofactor-binding domain-containing protein [Candidatus Binataceae bacterium]|nr:molybdopterin cofactor-binding domain-containing protein [Candidatus Binataceae bacterium]
MDTTVSRRRFLKGTGALIIGFSFSGPLIQTLAQGATMAMPASGELDSWLAIDPDGNATVYSGKVDVGMGVKTGLIQIAAEELYLAPERVTIIMGDTARTPNQGGTGASTSISLGAKPLRNAAAEAHRILLNRAALKLGVAADQLVTHNGVVSVKDHPQRQIGYGKLVSDRSFNEPLKVKGKAATLDVFGAARPKDPKDYTVVGTSYPRVDVAPKVMGEFTYMVDVRVPGMLHGRVVRPPGAGATVTSVDEASLRAIPGIVKVVAHEGFVGVIANSEWAAIQGATQLKVNWSKPKANFIPMRDLYAHMLATPPQASQNPLKQGDVESALAGAHRRLAAQYDWPFQSHATMGPGCAVAWVRKNGQVTIWSGAQKPPVLRQGIASLLKVPPSQVRVIWVEDAGSHGRPGFADVAADAALLSQAVQRPVRVQWMRHDMTGWGTKAPAIVMKLRGGLTPEGRIAALDFESWGFSGAEISPHYDAAGNFLGAQLSGLPNTTSENEFYALYGRGSAAYITANQRAVAHIMPPLYPLGSPMRTSHLRDPEGPQTTFAVESFIDELAAAAGADPVDFRLRHLSDPRSQNVIRVAARAAGWDPRPSPAKNDGQQVAKGRGISFAPRGAAGFFPTTYVATVAEVEVDRTSGEVAVTRLVCAQDCGRIINPLALKGTVEGNLIQSMSRALVEEVTYDQNNVTSVDWRTYPIVRSPQLPKAVEVVLINQPEIEPAGAGEPSTRPTAGAIANAIYDALGVRVRSAPMTPARIKAALAGAA